MIGTKGEHGSGKVTIKGALPRVVSVNLFLGGVRERHETVLLHAKEVLSLGYWLPRISQEPRSQPGQGERLDSRFQAGKGQF